jgi:hypothetical protein
MRTLKSTYMVTCKSKCGVKRAYQVSQDGKTLIHANDGPKNT